MARRSRNRSDLAAALLDKPAHYLECRDYGHVYRAHTAYPIDGGYERVFRCTRCDAERIQTLDRDGFIVPGSRMRYPDDYTVRGMGRMSASDRAALRLTNMGT